METLTVQGVEVPKLGFGTWNLTGETCYEAVSTALEHGYRHLDTAQAYGNEAAVGRAIADSDVDREEVFLTTKVLPKDARYERAVRAAEASVDRLGVDSVDLLLLHWPAPLVDVGETTRAFADLIDEGLVRNAGVSNFSRRRLAAARSKSPVPLLTDQVQFHPFRPQRSLLSYCQDEDVLLTAYSPLAHGGLLDDDVLAEVGRRYGKSAAQVALRWATQHHDVAVIPKASSESHIAANAAIFDFELSSSEVERITRPSLARTATAWLQSRL